MKVLVIGDSLKIRQRLINIVCESEDMELIGQSKVTSEAMNICLSLRPDMVIMDMDAQTNDSAGMLTQIKKCNASIVVIALSNYPFAEYATKCIESGADYFLEKSTEFDQIGKILRQVTHKANSRDAQNNMVNTNH